MPACLDVIPSKNPSSTPGLPLLSFVAIAVGFAKVTSNHGQNCSGCCSTQDPKVQFQILQVEMD